MGKKILKFINYTKEAFFWPLHLVTFGILGLATAAAAFAGNYFLGLDPTGFLFIFGGVELVTLTLITKSRRFRRAINGKYGKELSAYAYLKTLADTYNRLSASGQRRFEILREYNNEAKKNYIKLNQAFPDLVKDYLGKMDSLQMNFIRLLLTYENYPKTLQANHPDRLIRQIQEIREGMAKDNPKLKQIKQKRISLLEKRVRNFHDSQDDYQVMAQQLETIEEMIRFFAEQPLASNKTDDLATIDNLLEETTDLHSTLGDLDEIMRSDIQTPTSTGSEVGSGSSEEIYAR